MKKMTCNQLGRACEIEFQANTFDEMADLSKKHAIEMFQKGDQAHLVPRNKMQELMKSPEALNEWMQGRRSVFESLPTLD